MKPRISAVYEGMYSPSDLASGAPIVTKRIALASTLLVPVSAPGRAALAWGGRQAVVRTGTAIQAMVTDPLGVMQGTSRMLSTYKHATQVVGAYNYFNKFRNYKSSGSSSRAYQQNGSPGGTSKRSMVEPEWVKQRTGSKRWPGPQTEVPRCPPGYDLKTVKGRLMCVRRRTRKK